MAKYKMECSKCSAKFNFTEKMIGKITPCPKCGSMQKLEADASGDSGTTSSAGSGKGEFPERMKANKALDGRICPGCGIEIDLGDDVYNCPRCNSTTHIECFESAGGCKSSECSAATAAAPAPVSSEEEPGEDSKECRFCGETIKKGARKCRYCGEFQLARDRKKREERLKGASNDDSLTVGEIVFGIFCSWIAVILSIVWMIQGKKKGWKLFLLSIIFFVLQVMSRLSRH